MMRKLAVMALMLMTTAGSAELWANAGTATPGINCRQHRQMQRIRQGVRSGRLTKDEAKGLARDAREIRRMKRRAKADGTVTAGERKDINRRLNEEHRDIYRETHDAATR